MAVVASGDRDAFQLASATTTVLQPIKAGKWHASVLPRYASGTASIPDRYRISRAARRSVR
jgi:hypothetical protein